MKIGTLVIKSRKGTYQINSTVDGDAVMAALVANPELAREAVASMIQDNLQRSGPVWEPLAKGECESGTAWLIGCLKPTVKPNDVDKGEAAKWAALWQAPADKQAAFFAKLGLQPATDEATLAVSFARKRIAKEQEMKAAEAAAQAARHADLMALLDAPTPDVPADKKGETK